MLGELLLMLVVVHIRICPNYIAASTSVVFRAWPVVGVAIASRALVMIFRIHMGSGILRGGKICAAMLVFFLLLHSF